MTINVTEKHIEKGIKEGQGIAENCMLALALKDAGVKNPVVGYRSVGADNIPDIVWLPVSIERLIHDFTDGKPVKPFSFELETELEKA